MKRFYYEVFSASDIIGFCQYKFPEDAKEFIRKNENTLLATVTNDSSIKINSMISINSETYIHVSSRKYYIADKYKVCYEPIEITFVQKILKDEEKPKENV
jgi:hypothetical protein